MTTVADLVRVMHDIDVIKGRTCGTCWYGRPSAFKKGKGCRLGYAPYGPEDGCEQFWARYSEEWPKTHQWPSYEPDGPEAV